MKDKNLLKHNMTFIEEVKMFWSIFVGNVTSIVKRERPSFKKHHENAWTRQICRENGMDKSWYENN